VCEQRNAALVRTVLGEGKGRGARAQVCEFEELDADAGVCARGYDAEMPEAGRVTGVRVFAWL
jgi:hypothetical protein